MSAWSPWPRGVERAAHAFKERRSPRSPKRRGASRSTPAPPRPILPFLLLATSLAPALSPAPTLAAWPAVPGVNVPICTASGDQASPVIAPDESGGAVIAWQDHAPGSHERGNTQRIDANGAKRWPDDGVQFWGGMLGLYAAPSVVVSDGAGGAFGAINIGFPLGILASRVNGDGAPAMRMWAFGSSAHQAWNQGPILASDGMNGALITCDVTYSRYPCMGEFNYMEAARLDTGDVFWRMDRWGWLGCDGEPRFYVHAAAIGPDGTGGAYVGWESAGGLLATKLDAAGAPLWTDVGLDAGYAGNALLVGDGGGGVILTWTDDRGGSYAQRIGSAGVVEWAAGGVAVCPAAVSGLISDHRGGALIAWAEPGGGNRAQRITAAGGLAWGPDGIDVCPSAVGPGGPVMVPDGAGGAIVAWTDRRNGAADVFAQRVGPDGTLPWGPSGIPVSTAAGEQRGLVMVSDGAGGAILAWEDDRSGVDWDVYAQRVNANGTLGTLTVVLDVKPHRLNLKSKGKWVTGYIRPPDPFRASEIDVASIRLNVVVPVSPDAPAKIEDHDRMLKVKFARAAAKPTLSPGDHVPVTVTGMIAGRPFEGIDFIEVKAPRIHHPAAGDILAAGTLADVVWDVVGDPPAPTVSLFSSFDDGVTWNLEAAGLPNTGSAAWTVPAVANDHALLAVVQVYEMDETGVVPESEYGESEPFSIVTTTRVDAGMPALALRPANPAAHSLAVRLSVAAGVPATLAAFDLAGRQVASREIAAGGAGWRTTDLGDLPAGIYVVRLSQAGRSRSARVAVLR